MLPHPGPDALRGPWYSAHEMRARVLRVLDGLLGGSPVAEPESGFDWSWAAGQLQFVKRTSRINNGTRARADCSSACAHGGITVRKPKLLRGAVGAADSVPVVARMTVSTARITWHALPLPNDCMIATRPHSPHYRERMMPVQPASKAAWHAAMRVSVITASRWKVSDLASAASRILLRDATSCNGAFATYDPLTAHCDHDIIIMYMERVEGGLVSEALDSHESSMNAMPRRHGKPEYANVPAGMQESRP
jgi:hypothetical protein